MVCWRRGRITRQPGSVCKCLDAIAGALQRGVSMARNRYEGYCYCCGQYVPVGYGHFERYHGRWRIKCVKCASGRTVRDTDREVRRAKKLRGEADEETD